mmetsp:Transcript_18829/g.60576  ORF Transcript_18829/g.60576 Transcript_18829/m.60576 type:complete len:350 (-) Transcript_18829:676-1725(-)
MARAAHGWARVPHQAEPGGQCLPRRDKGLQLGVDSPPGAALAAAAAVAVAAPVVVPAAPTALALAAFASSNPAIFIASARRGRRSFPPRGATRHRLSPLGGGCGVLCHRPLERWEQLLDQRQQQLHALHAGRGRVEVEGEAHAPAVLRGAAARGGRLGPQPLLGGHALQHLCESDALEAVPHLLRRRVGAAGRLNRLEEREGHQGRGWLARRNHDHLAQPRDAQSYVGEAGARQVEGVEGHLRRRLADGLRREQADRLAGRRERVEVLVPHHLAPHVRRWRRAARRDGGGGVLGRARKEVLHRLLKGERGVAEARRRRGPLEEDRPLLRRGGEARRVPLVRRRRVEAAG